MSNDGSRSYTPGRAVLIGINEYKDRENHHSLQHGVSDALRLYVLLTHPQYGNFNPDRVKLLLGAKDGDELRRTAEEVVDELYKDYSLITRSGVVERIVKKQDSAERAAIIHLLDWYGKPVPSEDIGVVYFAGHGRVFNNVFYLVPTDMRADHYFKSALSLAEIKQYAQKSHLKHQVLILDACYPLGAGTGGTHEQWQAALSAAATNIAILTSCQPWQQARERKDRGLFTPFFVEGIVTGRADKAQKGYISLKDAYIYAKEQVADWLEKNYRYTSQTPTLDGEEIADQIILYGRENFEKNTTPAQKVPTEEPDLKDLSDTLLGRLWSSLSLSLQKRAVLGVAIVLIPVVLWSIGKSGYGPVPGSHNGKEPPRPTEDWFPKRPQQPPTPIVPPPTPPPEPERQSQQEAKEVKEDCHAFHATWHGTAEEATRELRQMRVTQDGRALVEAAGTGNTRTVELLLAAGVDKYLPIALWRAAIKGYCEVVQLLLDRKVKNGDAFIDAIYYGHTGIVKLMLEREYTVNTTSDNEDRTTYKRPPNVEHCSQKLRMTILFDHASVYTRTAMNVAVDMACECEPKHTDIVKLFLERQSEQVAVEDLDNLLSCAARDGNRELTQSVLSVGTTTGRPLKKDEALIATVEKEQKETAQMLLDAGADPLFRPNYPGALSAREWAVKLNNHEIVNMIDKAIDENLASPPTGVPVIPLPSTPSEASPPFSASTFPNPLTLPEQPTPPQPLPSRENLVSPYIPTEPITADDAKQELRKRGTPYEDQQIYWQAVETGDINLVRLFLSTEYYHYQSPESLGWGLVGAVKGGHLDLVKLFLTKKIDFKQRLGLGALFRFDSWQTGQVGERALRLASDKGHTEIVNLLLSHGVNSQREGQPALLAAIQGKHRDIVEALLKAGIDPVYSFGKKTLREIALLESSREIVLLIDAAIEKSLKVPGHAEGGKEEPSTPGS